jgi:hypothetical protein
MSTRNSLSELKHALKPLTPNYFETWMKWNLTGINLTLIKTSASGAAFFFSRRDRITRSVCAHAHALPRAGLAGHCLRRIAVALRSARRAKCDNPTKLPRALPAPYRRSSSTASTSLLRMAWRPAGQTLQATRTASRLTAAATRTLHGTTRSRDLSATACRAHGGQARWPLVEPEAARFRSSLKPHDFGRTWNRTISAGIEHDTGRLVRPRPAQGPGPR